MLRTLYAKLAAVLLGLLITLGALYGAFNLYATQVFLQELNQRFNRDLARQLLVQRNMAGGEWLKEEQIKELFSFYMHINPAIEIYLLDTSGNILAFEAPQMKIKRQQIDLAPIKQFLSGDQRYPIVGDDPRHETRQKIFSAAAYPFSGEPRQYLYVVLAGEDYDNVQALLHDSYFLQLSIAAVIGSVLFGLLAGLYAFNLLTGRLHRLTGLMERFRNSAFREHTPYTGASTTPQDLLGKGDEIDSLGATFDQMAITIIEQMRSLEQKDSLRRNLIANVSHDLRTPLASLQGYLETLLMKEGLSDDKRREYLDIAFRYSERLTRLVSELFELSKLEANESAPDFEPVALGELVQDMAQQLQLRAEQDNISLKVQATSDLPFVRADMAMVNRVLENLLGNALRHTPANGQVMIEVAPSAQGVATTISNTGPGISADDLLHVWERFYQAPERRHGSGAGLGLAIVKRIIELHDGTLWVDSSNGNKTSFGFSLPLWHKD